MRPLIRSLFLLSVAAAPLAMAEVPPVISPTAVAVSAATAASSAVSSYREVLVERSSVEELQATVDGMKGELSQLREQEDLRASVIGDSNVHALWP